MDMINLINKKKNGETLSYDEMKYIVGAFVNDDIADYQMSALLMAICLKGMSQEETFDLTQTMMESGDKLDLSSIEGIKVDKHSTGGVGDKTTLIVAPLVASCGVIVPKMSGRGLGHTGGTIDKLESISGFNVNLEPEEVINQLKQVGMVVTTSSLNFVPADKKIYALRDVTATVDSMPLIASSIMSKKVSTGADKIVLDVKVGKGAFMKKEQDATSLAQLMVDIGNHFGKETIAIVSNMNCPLGSNIGNSLEVIEAIDVLKNNKRNNLSELSITIASYMVGLGKNISFEAAKKMVMEKLEKGDAYSKFEEFVAAQKGTLSGLEVSDKIIEVKSEKEGYISEIDALAIGNITMALGAGRRVKTDQIDYGVGVILQKSIGDYVKNGDLLVKIYLGTKQIDYRQVYAAFKITEQPPTESPLIYQIVK